MARALVFVGDDRLEVLGLGRRLLVEEGQDAPDDGHDEHQDEDRQAGQDAAEQVAAQALEDEPRLLPVQGADEQHRHEDSQADRVAPVLGETQEGGLEGGHRVGSEVSGRARAGQSGPSGHVPPARSHWTSRPFSRCRMRSAASGRLGIVRHHQDRLVQAALQLDHQVQDFVGRLGVEIAGRLVGDDQRRVGDDGPGDADALLLAAGQLARPMTHAIRTGPPGPAPSSPAVCARPATSATAAAAARRFHTPSAPAADCRTETRSRRCGSAISPAGPRSWLLMTSVADPDDARRWAGPGRRSGSAASSCPSRTAPSARGTPPPEPSTLRSCKTSICSLPRRKSCGRS